MTNQEQDAEQDRQARSRLTEKELLGSGAKPLSVKSRPPATMLIQIHGGLRQNRTRLNRSDNSARENSGQR